MLTKPSPEQRVATPPQKPADNKADELLREQTKTETEQRPYLDTEGGE